MSHNTVSLTDDQLLVGARYKSGGTAIPVYDDSYGQVYVHRNSIGISGIVRAHTWEDAYGVCEDEFFPDANETMEEITKEYGFKRETRKVVYDATVTTAVAPLNSGERFDRPEDYATGKLPEGMFSRWVTIETPDPDAWPENELFCESFGFRSNSGGNDGKNKSIIYSKDLNGDYLDVLTQSMLAEWDIELIIEDR